MIPLAKPYLTEAEAGAAREAILSGWVTQGPRVAEFESRFAAYVGSRYAVALSSCTSALHLSLVTGGVGRGDEVICPSLSFIATANSVTYVGARPVFADVDPATYNMDVAQAEKLVTPRTKAVLVVHQAGMPADLDGFQRLCRERGLLLIEDAACAAGASYKGEKIGARSDLVCFSFHPRKVITTGDGGMVATSNPDFYERLKRLRQHGMSLSDLARHNAAEVVVEQYTEIGYNYRMTDIQAAIGVRQLEKLDWIVGERRKVARMYRERLGDIDCLRLPREPAGCSSNYQSFCVVLADGAPASRDAVLNELLAAGVAAKRGIMCAHREPAFASYAGPRQLAHTEALADRSISLPLYVPMPEAEVGAVVDALRGALARRGAV